jgi:hypothetical protein
MANLAKDYAHYALACLNPIARRPFAGWVTPPAKAYGPAKCVSFHFTQEARREMKRNLKRKHLSHESTNGSVDHENGAAAKFAR